MLNDAFLISALGALGTALEDPLDGRLPLELGRCRGWGIPSGVTAPVFPARSLIRE